MAMFPPLSLCHSPNMLSDKIAMGDILVALINGIGTVLAAVYGPKLLQMQDHSN